MKNINSPVEKHYTRDDLFELIVSKLKESGITKEDITLSDISAIDEFHIRGAEATKELIKDAGFSKDKNVLDVGCGAGGPARLIANEFGCKVTGIDLTEEFIRTANLLSELVGLEDLTEFICADATNMPFKDESFDIVFTQHAQMNIKEKKKLYSEIYRVLKKNGRFIYYDIFSGEGNEAPEYPMPWAEEISISHLISVKDYTGIMKELGFSEIEKHDHNENSLNFLRENFEKIAKEGPPKLGISILMKETAPVKLKNVFKNLSEKKLAVQSGTFEKR